MDPLVSTGWLAAELAGGDVVVLDATAYPPGDPRDADAAFLAARIPGARRFDIDRIADRHTSLPHMAPSAGFFAECLGELGISNTDRIVCYDQLGIFSAPRARWMLRLFGHDEVAVLDGGLPKWRSEGRPLQDGPAVAVPATRYHTALRAGLLRGLGDLRDNLRSRRELVLDARSAARFAARAAEPRPGLRGGHVPGARSLPYTELLTAQQTLLPPAELRARLALAGVDEKSAVVTTCGSGLTAAVLNLGLAVAGYSEGALYDGSWAEWGGREDTPVEAG
jgi:thiosulfate/3-mercaptopyruvate sulfurtransferase